jgi:hypothetical protein
MMNDPIVEEIRRYRKELSADYGNDLNRMVEALRKKEFESTRIQLNPGPKFLLKEQRISAQLPGIAVNSSASGVPPAPDYLER